MHTLYLDSAMSDMSIPTWSCGRRASATSQESWTDLTWTDLTAMAGLEYVSAVLRLLFTRAVRCPGQAPPDYSFRCFTRL
jgi:hypothetical protein